MADLLIFKISHNIKSKVESEILAKLEIEGLLNEVPKPIENFYDIMKYLKDFEDFRISNRIFWKNAYGKVKGYYLFLDINEKLIEKLIKRLAYFSEIYLLTKRELNLTISPKLYEKFQKEDKTLYRFITYSYFLEKSEYISKLSRNEKEIDRNIEILFKHPFENIYYIPAPQDLKMGKKLEDYFSNREENSLYLTHYFYPYKGKFHPKMVRSLLNWANPRVVLDNFVGSGTLLVEASLMEIESYGVDINPLCVLMSKVKTSALFYQYEKINIPIFINFQTVKNFVESIKDEQTRDFYKLVLAGTISDILRNRKKDFKSAFLERLRDLELRIYLFKKLNETLRIKPMPAFVERMDTRKLNLNKKFDSIITSPPYAIALDYIKNDKDILKLVFDLDFKLLEEDMIGNPRENKTQFEMPSYLENKLEKFKNRPQIFKFYSDIYLTIKKMKEHLKEGSKNAIIIGNDKLKEGLLRNDLLISDILQMEGFKIIDVIERDITKNVEGAIKEESIILFYF